MDKIHVAMDESDAPRRALCVASAVRSGRCPFAPRP